MNYPALHSTNQYMHCSALHCAALNCNALHCTVLYCTVMHCTVLYCSVLHCTAVYSIERYCRRQHCALYCTVCILHCPALQQAQHFTFQTLRCIALHFTNTVVYSNYISHQVHLNWLEEYHEHSLYPDCSLYCTLHCILNTALHSTIQIILNNAQCGLTL